MIEPLALLLGLVVPALVAAAIVVIGRGAAAPAAGWVAGAALATAYVLGHAGFLGWPAMPPRTVEQWVPLAALVAAIVGAASARAPAWLVWTLRAVVLGASLALWLAPVMTHRWTVALSFAWMAGLLGLALAVCAGIDRVLPALAPSSAWSATAATFGGAGAALALSGSLALGQLAGSAAAAACGGLAASTVTSTRPIGRASVLVVVLLVSGLALCGTLYSELPRASAALLVLAPLAARAVPHGLRASRRGPVAVGAVVGLVAAAAAAIAFALSPDFDSY